MMAFMNRAKSIVGINATSSGPKQAQIVFTKQFEEPCTVCTQEPMSSPGRHAFEVSMPIKEGHVALGFCRDPTDTTYMTPNFREDTSHYVSLGGAGFIYPQQQSTDGRYGQGDTVLVEMDVNEQGKGAVRWRVNGKVVAVAAWDHGLPVWPAISCKAGHVVCDVKFP